MKVGDRVRITYGGQVIDGLVTLASENEVSLLLQFDGALWLKDGDGAFFGMMAVLRREDGSYRDIIDGAVCKLERLP